MTTPNLHTLTYCGCKVTAAAAGVNIEYCNLHRAAPDLLLSCLNLLEIAKSARQYLGGLTTDNRLSEQIEQAQAAIVKSRNVFDKKG